MPATTVPALSRAAPRRPHHARLQTSEHFGMLMLAGLVAAFALTAFWFDPSTYAHQLTGYVRIMLVHLLPFAIAMCAVGLILTIDRSDPVGGSLRSLRRIVVRTGPVLAGLVALMSAFTTFKTNIPTLTSFWADALFADLDEAIHGGVPVATLHAALPSWAGQTLLFAYGTPWFLAWLGVPLAVAAQPLAPWRTRYLYSFTLTIILLGVVAATLLASVGPVFYDGVIGEDRFAFLDASYAVLPGLDGVRSYADHLQSSYETGHAGLGTGISAMPSMHCAGAILNAYLFASLNRWAGLLGWGFAALIVVGSVYTGWHYAVDGYVSFVGVTAIWFGTGAVSRRLHTPLRMDSSHA